MAARRADTVTIRIVRTGGLAGLRREWTAAVSGPEADEVRELVDSAHWGAAQWRSEHWDSEHWGSAPVDPGSVDRFVWSIHVTGCGRRRSLRLPETHLAGPVQQLVERVQREGRSAAPDTETGAG